MCARCSAVLVEATAKVCVIVDGCGRAVAFELAPGQAHKLPMAPGPLDCLPDVPGWVVGDSGLASDAFREPIWDLRVSNALLKGSGCLCEEHEVMGEDAEDDFAALRLAVPSGQG